MNPYQDFMQFLTVMAIAMARVVSCFSVVPFLGGNMLPQYIRNTLVFAIFLSVYPYVAPTAPETLPLTTAALLMAKEVFIGLLMGFMVGIIFWSAEITGFLIDNQRGASMANVLDPLYGHNTSPLGTLLLQLVTVLFFATGGFLVFLEGVFESYRFWPVYDFFPSMDLGIAPFFLEKADQLMRMGLLLASPFLIGIFLIDLSLGLINRFVPQFNVFFLSMPVKSGLASMLMVLYLTVIVTYYAKYWAGMDRVIQALRGWMG